MESPDRWDRPRLVDLTIWTIGHSTRPFLEFLKVLAPYSIEAIADVRRHPGSRRQPQYHQPTLRTALSDHGIKYSWFAELGGRRTPRRDSINEGWRHPAFRGYADHLATEDFNRGLAALLQLARDYRTAMMCSEALWWRCHRRLISDVFVSRGAQVVHILSATKSAQHKLARPAQLIDGRLSYAGEKSDE